MSMKRIETWERDGGAWQGRIRIFYSHFQSLFHTYARCSDTINWVTHLVVLVGKLAQCCMRSGCPHDVLEDVARKHVLEHRELRLCERRHAHLHLGPNRDVSLQQKHNLLHQGQGRCQGQGQGSSARVESPV